MTTRHPIRVPSTLRWLTSQIILLRPAGQDPLVHLPDADTSLVLRTTPAGRADLLVAGPRTRATYHVGKDLPLCLRLRLRPGAARLLLGVPAGELVDRVVDIGELWNGTQELKAALMRSGQDPRRILEHLQAALPARIAARSHADLARYEQVQAAAEALRDHHGQRREPIPAIARRLAISERHLRDAFRDGVGLPPKRFERIERVRHVLTHGRRPKRWSQLAVTAGYYDQSHMTAEFRTLMGVTPTAYFTGRLPALQPC
ncbi:helix-turn-helix domain-containing protein [Nonomuraea sp. NPDC050383]|uniref:helix-turn-helix domain-containing protein n=1 Tax=Nonomuraea sp. NPDC050383 TaxID=3364362 RepID=UPI0037B9D721